MRNNLYGMSAEISTTFFIKDTPVYFTGSNIRLFI